MAGEFWAGSIRLTFAKAGCTSGTSVQASRRRCCGGRARSPPTSSTVATSTSSRFGRSALATWPSAEAGRPLTQAPQAQAGSRAAAPRRSSRGGVHIKRAREFRLRRVHYGNRAAVQSAIDIIPRSEMSTSSNPPDSGCPPAGSHDEITIKAVKSIASEIVREQEGSPRRRVRPRQPAKYLRSDELARELPFSKRTLQRHAAHGDLPAFKLPGSHVWLFDPNELRSKLLTETTTTSPEVMPRCAARKTRTTISTDTTASGTSVMSAPDESTENRLRQLMSRRHAQQGPSRG